MDCNKYYSFGLAETEAEGESFGKDLGVGLGLVFGVADGEATLDSVGLGLINTTLILPFSSEKIGDTGSDFLKKKATPPVTTITTTAITTTRMKNFFRSLKNIVSSMWSL